MPRDTPAPDPEAVAALADALHAIGIACDDPDPDPGPLTRHEHDAQALLTALAADPAARRAVVAELLDVDVLAEALVGQNLYHGRYGTTPAGRATAAAILAVLRGQPDGEPARP